LGGGVSGSDDYLRHLEWKKSAKFYAGEYDAHKAPAGVRYYWIDDTLGGAHEYGDNWIMDTQTKGERIFACSSGEDAEKLCEMLNRLAPVDVWEGS
jgi:hypothetical protein